jgi:hypothetical protein
MSDLAEELLEAYRRERAARLVLASAPPPGAQGSAAVVTLLPLPLVPRPAADGQDPPLAEPSARRVLEHAAATWLSVSLVEAAWAARHAEWSARTWHLEASRQSLVREVSGVHEAYGRRLRARTDAAMRDAWERHGRIRYGR